MPQTTYMERHDRHDHGFTIPDPKLTLDFGIPNACNRCHVEQDANWALDHVEKWYGKRRDRTARDRVRERVQWIEKVRRGERMEGEELLRQLDAETQPFWQASITQLLGAYTSEIGVRARLTAQLTHTNAMVRAQSIHGLAPWLESEGTTIAARTRSGAELRRAVEARLTDPVRQVRLQAAWALRSELDLDSVAGRDLMHLLRLHADQPTGQLQLGNFHWDRKDPGLALQHFSKAIDWDPNSAVIRHEHAILLSLTGNQDAARRELEHAVALAPGEAEYRYKLGLAWNETGDVRRARSELLEAVQLDPQHARAWYNLGLAESSMELLESALDRLIRAETVDPIDPRAPYARATIHARLGQFREAREAALESLRRHPGYGPAEGLLRQLPR
jgi:Flp pilus assembly protein TadD